MGVGVEFTERQYRDLSNSQWHVHSLSPEATIHNHCLISHNMTYYYVHLNSLICDVVERGGGEREAWSEGEGRG